ncbi:hypothetical protein FAZ15_20355 [Sphingobacterium olei]|uniref:Molybdopterin-synthase adenylyltransferase n=1 Tax=Sphingobacterium olei TaxID=2571155 RepID=A0A4U0NBX6_9SPHI|nr:HesA/MoeB/ThiF family protein [Sphingobacterium olei]TJZ51471.1 hypothetical protein FAZ15_20355 [Sphingobacterium olei]
MNWDPRYERHYTLPGFGHVAQEKLATSKVLVVGAGGLGCPVLQYLTASGVGYIGVMDFDTIQLSNLQRQTIYPTASVGQLKTKVAAEQLRLNNPSIEIIEHPARLSKSNAGKILQQYDIIVDCTDNFEARYVLNDYCVVLQKPLVFAAIYQYEGQVAIFNVSDEQGTACNYRDLFPEIPNANEAPNCSENGVLGVLPGIIGLIQATEVIKLITGLGDPLVNKLMTWNVLNYQSMILEITHRADFHIPDIESLDSQQDVDDAHRYRSEDPIDGIHPREIETYLHNPEVCLLDVRELYEEPPFPLVHQGIPLSTLSQRINELSARHIIVVCQSGQRSMHAAQYLKEHFGKNRRISHLVGGIVHYLNYKKAE